VRRAFLAVAQGYGPVVYHNHIRPLGFAVADGKITLVAPGLFERDWIKQRYHDDMVRAAGMPIDVVAQCRD